MPEDVSLNAIARFFIQRMNKRWERERVSFDRQDYRDLHAAYWMRYDHQLVSVELSEAQTSALVARCRREDVTVNSALAAAFAGAQAVVLGEKQCHPSIAVDRLRPRPHVPGVHTPEASDVSSLTDSRGMQDRYPRCAPAGVPASLASA
ncbi:MAG: hypothetical protein PVF54_05210, partial [Anaerolineae bacterium]|jgi:hypothetical protein